MPQSNEAEPSLTRVPEPAEALPRREVPTSTIQFVPGDGKDKGYYLVQTPGGHKIRLGATDPVLQQMAQQLSAEILEGNIDDEQALLPARIAGRFIDLLREKGLTFKGETLDDAWEALNLILKKMVDAQKLITEMKGQSVAQRTLDAIGQNLNVGMIGWMGLNPAMRESIATFIQSLTVSALQQGHLIDDGTVDTAEKIADIHEKLQARRSGIEHLLGRAAEGLGTAIEGAGTAVDGVLSGATNHIEEIPAAAGRGLGGLLGDGIRSGLDRSSTRRPRNKNKIE